MYTQNYYSEIKVLVDEFSSLERIVKKVGDLHTASQTVANENEVLEDMLNIEKERLFKEYQLQFNKIMTLTTELNFFYNELDEFHRKVANQIKAYIEHFGIESVEDIGSNSNIKRPFKDGETLFTFTVIEYLNALERTFKPNEHKEVA